MCLGESGASGPRKELEKGASANSAEFVRYACSNDVSARKWQLPLTSQWSFSKGFGTLAHVSRTSTQCSHNLSPAHFGSVDKSCPLGVPDFFVMPSSEKNLTTSLTQSKGPVIVSQRGCPDPTKLYMKGIKDGVVVQQTSLESVQILSHPNSKPSS